MISRNSIATLYIDIQFLGKKGRNIKNYQKKKKKKYFLFNSNALFESLKLFYLLKFLIILNALPYPLTLFFRVSKFAIMFICCPAQLDTIKTFKVIEYWPKLLVIIKVK